MSSHLLQDEAPSTRHSPTSTPRPSPKSRVALVPWDPDSPDHLERLRLQRIECGWKYDWVEKWRPLQREGKIALQWVVFTKDDNQKEEKLLRHITAYPGESRPLLDTAKSLGGKPREPTSESFIPVGHISLDTEYEDSAKLKDPSENGEGIYWIATFYISGVLQQYGLGRAAMDYVEAVACDEPLNARVLALSTQKREYPLKKELYAAMGREVPSLLLQDWYARRGYVLYRSVDQMWCETDPTGKKWWISGVFMKKEITK